MYSKYIYFGMWYRVIYTVAFEVQSENPAIPFDGT